jgi:hypothetical protein
LILIWSGVKIDTYFLPRVDANQECICFSSSKSRWATKKNNFLIHPSISSFYLFFKKVLVGDLFLLPKIEEAF